MKFSKKQLQEHILSEVNKIALKEGWIQESNVINIPAVDIKFEDANTVAINEEVEKIELKEVKLLAEEVKRMKDLVDFRSPLLRKENQ